MVFLGRKLEGKTLSSSMKYPNKEVLGRQSELCRGSQRNEADTNLPVRDISRNSWRCSYCVSVHGKLDYDITGQIRMEQKVSFLIPIK